MPVLEPIVRDPGTRLRLGRENLGDGFLAGFLFLRGVREGSGNRVLNGVARFQQREQGAHLGGVQMVDDFVQALAVANGFTPSFAV